MKHLIILLLSLLIVSCNKYQLNDEDIVKANSEQIFGVNFPSEQDWVTTINSSINIDLGEYSKILVMASSDSIIKVLNSSETSGTITFDVPDSYDNLYCAFVDKDGRYYYKKFNLEDKTISTKALRRVQFGNYNLPDIDLTINETVETWASKRNWLPGEVFYKFNYENIILDDYDSDFKEMFKDIIFNYFPNGRKYNNLPQIKKSGYYNDSSYPITTGDKPIIVSPVYKNDGGYHEISEAELYYYYYDERLDLSTEEIEALPKYKAIDLSEVYTNEDNGNVLKNKSYALVYWGDNIPEIGITSGTYKFPSNYKIGFVYKSNTTYEAPKKQGELYGDGRLNYNINNWGNFKSSKLGLTEPRMAWMSINDKMFLCIESGTDTDFNDLILEVEGGIKPIIIIPDEPEYQSYMFCFEDHRLGDYDMNDVVLKGVRLDETHVEYTLMATGASDNLYIYNVEGKHINKNNEVHAIFGKSPGIFVNTLLNDNTPYVKDTITVNKNFSFLDVDTQPYIYDATKGWEVKISRRGEDPHAIMIPYDFRWPLERVCVKDAYLDFNNWGMMLIEETDWYKNPVEDKIY